MRSKISTDELFAKAKVGVGATKHVGSDAYPYYVAFVDPSRKVIGLYQPKTWFKHDWTDGHMEVEEFKDGTAPGLFLQAFRGSWHVLDTAGRRCGKFDIVLGYASSYQDPSL